MSSAERDVVEFRSEDSTNALVRLSYDPADSDFGMLVVDIRADGLTCEEGALSLRGDGLDAFLASLAADWRGWDGTRRWDTIKQELTIEATHHGRRAELLFTVRPPEYKPDAWQVRFPVFVAPGESLARLAKAATELFKTA